MGWVVSAAWARPAFPCSCWTTTGGIRACTHDMRARAQVPPGGPPRSPDALIVSEDSRVHWGVLAAGSRSGSVVAMGGTSVAAPRAARWIADDLGAGGRGDRAAVQAHATADE